jgi:hypothetical protein
MSPPPQEPVNPLGVDTTRPAGSVSAKFIENTVLIGSVLSIVKLRVVLPPSGMCVAPKTLLMGGALWAHRPAGKTRAIHNAANRGTEKDGFTGDFLKSKLGRKLRALNRSFTLQGPI